VSSTVIARVAGLAGAVLLAAAMYLGIQFATSPPGGSYEVTVQLGVRAGQGVSAGTDVKAKGVIVGEVAEVWLDDDARPMGLLTIFPDYPLPPPDEIEVVIGNKTFLGPKQVELHFDGPIAEPYLAAGDVLEVTRGPEEAVDVFDEFADVMAAVPGDRLGEIYEAFSHFTPDDAEIAGRNIELSDEMFQFHARTAELQVQNLTDLADITEAIAPRTEDINRITATVPIWASLLPDRQEDMRANFESLSQFAEGFAEFLEVNEPDLSELINLGHTVLTSIEPRIDQVGGLIDGLRRYSNQFLRHNYTLDDGSEYGFIRVLLPVFEEMCHRGDEEQQEQMGEFMPGCPTYDGGPDYDSGEDDG
jgi:virulence factor Mce-like protein